MSPDQPDFASFTEYSLGRATKWEATNITALEVANALTNRFDKLCSFSNDNNFTITPHPNIQVDCRENSTGVNVTVKVTHHLFDSYKVEFENVVSTIGVAVQDAVRYHNSSISKNK